ncbi:MAG: hypothetical protein Q4C39_06035 [Clostridia bacterium]|nr:hypothetical protein [Clostridia bacterium]
MKKNLYKKFQKVDKVKKKYNENLIVEKSQMIKTILSFTSDMIGKIIKIIFYILIVALCSLGATCLFNYILRGGVLW